MDQYFEFAVNALLIGLELYQFILLIYVLSSWFGGLPRNRFGYFIVDMMRPILKLVRLIPHRIGMIDISPIYAIFLIGFARHLVFVTFQT